MTSQRVLTATAAAATALICATAQAASTATISFSSGAGFFDIFLTNTTLDNLGGAQASQLLTGVSFTVANGPADLAGSAVAYVAGDVISWQGGSKTDLPDAGAAWAWGPAVAGFPNYLNALNGSVGSNGPDFGIVNSAVTGVGASLANAPHNPMYQGMVQFRIFNAAVTADTRFDDVQPLFNTAPPTPIPEPGTYVLLLAGLAAIGLGVRGRRL